jgi:formylglycine-generating enzyme required for sulfatase activity
MNHSPLDHLQKLLESPVLRVGASTIRRCSTAEIAGPELSARSATVFLGRVVVFSAAQTALIILDPSESEIGLDHATGIPSDVAAVLPDLARRFAATYIWYVSARLGPLRRVQFSSYTVAACGVSSFFAEILEVRRPFTPAATSEVDLEGHSYRNAFQRRYVWSRSPDSSPSSPMSVDACLRKWADADSTERPILLLGDRGAGKTWQLLKFCEEQTARAEKEPWRFPPAFYLSLRRARDYVMNSLHSPVALYTMLADRYAGFTVNWDLTMFSALLQQSQLIVCFDGLDELEVQPSPRRVHEHLRRLTNLFPMGARVILSARTTYFASFVQLFALPTWPDSDVAGTFRILELTPFRTVDLDAYASAVDAGAGIPGAARLRGLLQTDGGVLAEALRRCCLQPALAARVVSELTENPSISTGDLLERAIEGSLISFNLDAERTWPLLLDDEGRVRTFDSRTRAAFLGELAWFMAERRLDAIDIDRLPRRLTSMFGLESEPLQSDIRSQTVFELIEPTQADENAVSVRPRGSVRFGLGLANDRGAVADSCDVEVPPLSVARSYFLASHICERLSDSDNIPGVEVRDTLQFLGRVKLDRVTAAILRERLPEAARLSLIEASRLFLFDLAARGDFGVFQGNLRYLVTNLKALGYLSESDALLVDPWPPHLECILRPPAAIPDYEFVLVPPASSAAIRRAVIKAGAAYTAEAFLLGRHEITNEQFARFYDSPAGGPWAIEEVTRAASKGSHALSLRSLLTNEYHLYFWEPVSGQSHGHQPPKVFLRHPVVYVSWYIAADFCNWLSISERYEPAYEEVPPFIKPSDASDRCGFRLPAASEWWWAAQGVEAAADYPWDLLPYPVPLPSVESSAARPSSGEACEWLRQFRAAAKSVLLDSGRRSSEVAFDDDVGPFGVIGLIGNVKEWVDDLVGDRGGVPKAVVCGGTAHLGLPSFRVGYYATLFPQNTNPDVGFRVARSLTAEEREAFRLRERQITEFRA